LEVSLCLEQTTTSRTSQITAIRILRTHRILTAQTTAILRIIRRTARTAIITITTNNRCWNGKRQDLNTSLAFFAVRAYISNWFYSKFYLTDRVNEYNILKENMIQEFLEKWSVK